MKGASPSFDNLSNDGDALFAFVRRDLLWRMLRGNPDLTVCRTAAKRPLAVAAPAFAATDGGSRNGSVRPKSGRECLPDFVKQKRIISCIPGESCV